MAHEEIRELQKRCKASDIPFEEHEDEHRKWWTVALPCDRERELIHLEADHIGRFLAIPFERYVFLDRYVAICCYKERIIEAAIQTPRPDPLGFYVRLLGWTLPMVMSHQDLTLELKQEESDEKRIRIGPISNALHTLWYHSLLGGGPTKPQYERKYEHPPSLRIEGIQVSQHGQALDILERIADSLFLQIDLSLDILLSLVPKRRFSVSITDSTPKEGRTGLQFPQYEYDQAPMKLYWYARSATGMPLLQFLA
jgi:hypothetical protein